jgi:hypothetical protein
MTQAHLTTERLLAIRDGESDNSRELEHLSSCPECQETFDDSRWVRLLAKLRRGERRAGPHLGPDELLAYHMQALSRPRLAKMREHLEGCRICLAAYARSRETSKRNRYSSPSPGALRSVMERFRPRKMKRLGRLLVKVLRDGIDVSFEAEAAISQMRDHFSETMAGRGAERRHPSSAKRRIQRLTLEDAALESLRFEDAGAPLMNAAMTGSEAAPILGLPWGLRVTAVPGTRDLRVTLTPIATDRSPRGVEVRIVPERGEEFRSTTDERGTAVLRCPPGNSRLVVEVEPPLVVQVEFDG